MSKFNSFNPYKILFHSDKLKQVANNEIPKPISIDIDLSNICNHNCFFCNAAYIRHQSNYCQITFDDIKILVNNINKYWANDLKTICFAGGGEPFCHPEASKIIKYVSDNTKCKISVITNGSLLTEYDCEILSNTCRYVGISFDAATEKTYNIIRNTNTFNKTINNIKLLSSYINKNKLTDVCIKTLINHYNYNELYDIALLSKELNVSSMHIRPVGIDNVLDKNGQIIGNNYNLKKYKDIILKQFTKIEKLKTETFKPYIVTHQFGENFEQIIPFKKCRITPLSAFVFAADKNGYICLNNRGKQNFNLGNWNDIFIKWGTNEHIQLINKINPHKCMRCASSFANTLIEETIINDNMYRDFV